MFTDQFSSFSKGNHHLDTPSLNKLLAQFETKISSQKLASLSPGLRTPSGFSESSYVKKRSYSDHAKDSQPLLDEPSTKRSRTAPPSPPMLSRLNSASSGLAPAKPVLHEAPAKVTLPSLSDALCGLPSLLPARHPKSIIPTVSLDYFDTYKPNDENWRYGLLDSIKSTKPSFSFSSYSYLEKHASGTATSGTKLPSIDQLRTGERPHFDTRVSLKALPTLAERKINFPYESNYTYLNKTYLTDVERYPEYLELAQSLIQLSKPHQTDDHTQLYPKLHTYKQEMPVSHHDDAHHHNHNHNHNHHHHHEEESASYDRYHHYKTPVSHHDKYASSYATPSEPYSSYVTSPSSTRLPHISTMPYASPDASFEYKTSSPTAKKDKKVSLQRTRFIPITPPSVKDKTRSELMKSPPRSNQTTPRVCISCGSDQSPCWRPSWSIKEGQLCNSCGLRYKKTATRCLNDECKKIPAKGEWSLMQTKGKTTFDDGDKAYSCLDCGWKVEVKK